MNIKIFLSVLLLISVSSVWSKPHQMKFKMKKFSQWTVHTVESEADILEALSPKLKQYSRYICDYNPELYREENLFKNPMVFYYSDLTFYVEFPKLSPFEMALTINAPIKAFMVTLGKYSHEVLAADPLQYGDMKTCFKQVLASLEDAAINRINNQFFN